MNRQSLKSWLLTGLLLGAVILSGCSSIKMETVNDQSAVIKLKRLYVLVNNRRADQQTFSTSFATAFAAALTNDPVELEIETHSLLELDEKIHLKDEQAFAPDAALVVTDLGGLVSPYGGYPTIIYDASLCTPDLKRRIWRARIDNSGGTEVMGKRMRDMADKIVEQLRHDGYLPKKVISGT